MASVKGSNTSKTAHVMNLLSRNRGAEPPLPTDGAAASALPEDTHSPQAPPILTSLQNDMAVSSAIKDALQASLEEEAEAPAPSCSMPEPPVPSLSQENHMQDASPSAETPPAKKTLKLSRLRSPFPLPQSARPPAKTLCSFWWRKKPISI